MTRTGLLVALAIAVVVGIVFGVDGRFDIDISALFYQPKPNLFQLSTPLWAQQAREAARLLIALIAAPAFLAIIGKLILPRRRMLIEGRAALLIVVTLALGPGLIANTLLKDHWGRVRPVDIIQFGGTGHFTPWWDPRGDCPNNCSFIAGEAAGAFWTLGPASFAPPQWRLVAYGAALAFGAAVGVLRIGAGGHFFTDVVFAGVVMYLLLWSLHGLIFRWRATRMAEHAVERPLARAGEALRNAVAALTRRIGGGTGKPS
jgi:lipid A 4'-phosphatase